MNRNVYFFLLLLSLFFSACQIDSSPAEATASPHASLDDEPTLLAVIPTTTSTIPPSLTPLPTATPIRPTETLVPTGTSTATPLSTSTSTPRPSLTPSATVPPIRFEWLSQSYFESDPGLLSVSGGVLYGFEYEAPYLVALLGKSLAVYDMDSGPLSSQLNQVSLPDRVTEMVRSDRFLFLTQSDHILVVDISELPTIRPIARIDGLRSGRLYRGKDGGVYFTDSNRRTWLLDVDPELPAKRLDSPPNVFTVAQAKDRLVQEYGYPIATQIEPQFESLFPGSILTFWVDIFRNGDELIVGYATSGEGGGGAVLRVDISDLENPILLSAFKTFTPQNIAVAGDLLAAGFLSETASELTLVNVSRPDQPQFLRSLPYHSNGLALRSDGTLFAGNRPGIATVQLDQAGNETLVGELELEQPFANYLQQMVLHPSEPLLYGLPGLYEKGGLVVFSVADMSRPELLSMELGINWHQITYYNNTVYGVDRGTLKLVDVSDPTSPELRHEILIDGTVGGFALWPADEDRLLAAVLTEQALQIIDVTDPADAVVLSTIETPAQCARLPDQWGHIQPYDRALAYVAGYLYSPLGRCNVYKIDVSDLDTPRIVDSLVGDGPLMISDRLLYIGGSNLWVYEIE